jgi:DNA repair exonuclease SbcCD ATPase subunit
MGGGSYLQVMKRVFVFALLCLLGTAPLMRGQTTPPPPAPPASPPAGMSQQEIEQNYKSLKGEVADLKETKDDFQKRFEEIHKALDKLREQMDKPNPTYATKEDLKRLADAIQEVDRKREEDTKRILDEFAKLGTLIAPPPGRGGSTRPPPTVSTNLVSRGDETGVWYTVKANDSFSTIAAAYRAQDHNIKVTKDQIAKANPDKESNKLQIGQKLFIPLSKPAEAK